MTKVQAVYSLSRKLGDADLESLSRVHSVYGIYQARVNPSLDELQVEYDASRLTRSDLQARLEQFGLPLQAA